MSPSKANYDAGLFSCLHNEHIIEMYVGNGMDEGRNTMYDNKKMYFQFCGEYPMRSLQPEQVQPVIRLVNYFEMHQRGIAWGERDIPDPELVFVIKGRFRYEPRDDAAVDVRAGHVLFIPPLVRHTLRRIDGGRSAVISCIHGELALEGSLASGAYRLTPQPQRVTMMRDPKETASLFHSVCTAYEGYGRHRHERVQSLVKAIWLYLCEHWQTGGSSPISLRMERMMAFLRERACAGVTRHDLSVEFGLTPEHINALFKKELGVTPTEFVHRERIHLAYRAMREEGLSVKQAAARFGFCDPFHFSKLFKRYMGYPPSRV
jgi:AraC-like DNA-binding protein